MNCKMPQIALHGDNPGLNQMLGFTDSFTHGKSCRICRTSIELINSLTQEVLKLLENKNAYILIAKGVELV